MENNEAKLLASMIGSDTKACIARCEKVLSGYGSLKNLLTAVVVDKDCFGVSLNDNERAKLLTLKEIFSVASWDVPVEHASTPWEVARCLSDIAICREEVLMLVALDSRNKIRNKIKIASGWEGGINIHPNQIMSLIFREGFTRVILAHNHPSGESDPSREDIAFTNNIIYTCKQIGVDLLDHVIIVKNGYFSMREHRVADFT